MTTNEMVGMVSISSQIVVVDRAILANISSKGHDQKMKIVHNGCRIVLHGL